MIFTTPVYDINQTILTELKLFPKFQFIVNFRVQIMHDYVHWHCSTDYCIKLILRKKNHTPPRESGLSPVTKRLAHQSQLETGPVKGQHDINNQSAPAARNLSFHEDTPPTWLLYFFDDFETRMQEIQTPGGALT